MRRKSAATVAQHERLSEHKSDARCRAMVGSIPSAAVWVASVERLETARAALERAAAELHAIAFSDIGDYFGEGFRPLPLSEVLPAARKALAVYRVTRRTLKDGSVRETVVVRLHDKQKALACLARLYGTPVEYRRLVMGSMPRRP